MYGFAAYTIQPVRFEFIFYKPENKWFLFNIDYRLDVVPEIRKLSFDESPVN